MIARLVLLAGLALLAGCVAPSEGTQQTAPVVAAADADAQPASVEPTTTPVHVEPQYRASSPRNAAARAACLADGGIFSGSDLGGFTCVRRTRDADKVCTASNQCQGVCLSRSGSCSPVTPLLGCIDIFDDNGDPAIVCLN